MHLSSASVCEKPCAICWVQTPLKKQAMAPPEAKCIEDQMVQVKEVKLLLSGTVWSLYAIAGSNALLAIVVRSNF